MTELLIEMDKWKLFLKDYDGIIKRDNVKVGEIYSPAGMFKVRNIVVVYGHEEILVFDYKTGKQIKREYTR